MKFNIIKSIKAKGKIWKIYTVYELAKAGHESCQYEEVPYNVQRFPPQVQYPGTSLEEIGQGPMSVNVPTLYKTEHLGVHQ